MSYLGTMMFDAVCAMNRAVPFVRWHSLAARLLPPPPYADRLMRWQGQGRLVVNLANPRERELYVEGRYEPHVLSVLKQVTPAGGTVVDLGANLGVHTTALSLHVGERGRVFAVEANPYVVERLRQNVASSPHYANIEVIPVGVSDQPGTLPFYYPPDRAEWSKGRLATHAGEDDWLSVDVEVTTLDALMAARSHPHVDTIKCDVEGFDVAALRGAAETIARSRPAIVLEYVERLWRRAGFTLDDLREALPGYTFAYIPLWRHRTLIRPAPVAIRRVEDLPPAHRNRYELLARRGA
ncbi:MAG: FkbM family methyltransferase [Chloroflexi bacterium]|nr:FkbM family methyltransferase [Chloroflexota bacterium]